MARTVDNTLVLPTRSTTARSTVADSNRRGSGHLEVARAVNTLLEQYRGSLICDVDPLGIWTIYSQIHPYRVPLQGVSSSDEPLDVWVYGSCPTGGQCGVRCSSLGSGDLASVTVIGSTVQWYYVGQVDTALHGADYDTLSFQWTSPISAHPKILAICAFYARDRVALPAVAAGQLAYPDGAVPHDLVAAADERVLTASRALQPHANLRALYARPWPFVASSLVRAPWTGGSLYWRAEVPPQIVARTITARLYTYVSLPAGPSTPTLSVTFSAGGGNDFAPLAGAFTGWLGPFDVEVTAPAEGVVRPQLTTCRLNSSGDSHTITSICGWWTGLAYGA